MAKHHKVYTEEEYALFARHRDDRARLAPTKCHGGNPQSNGLCWVKDGPPAMRKAYCEGCHGYPKAGPWRDSRWYPPYPKSFPT